MFRDRPGWKPVPYTPEEKEEMERDGRIMQQEMDDIWEEERREKIAEWKSSTGKDISMHLSEKYKQRPGLAGELYFKIGLHGDKVWYRVADLRRPTADEKKNVPDIYAVLDNGEQRMGLTQERYMALRAKLV